MPTQTHINEIALQNQVKCVCSELKLRYKGLCSGQWDNNWMLHKPKYKLLKLMSGNMWLADNSGSPNVNASVNINLGGII